MSATVRPYRQGSDYGLVYDFLAELYEPDDRLPCWLPPRWEYMHGHPFITRVDLSSIGIAQTASGEVVGVVHPEAVPTQRYLQVRPRHEGVRRLLVEWAERHAADPPGEEPSTGLGFFVDDTDMRSAELLAGARYTRVEHVREPHARRRLDEPLPEADPPAGYRLQSLAEENDQAKVDRVPWRGFDHPAEPDWSSAAARARPIPGHAPIPLRPQHRGRGRRRGPTRPTPASGSCRSCGWPTSSPSPPTPITRDEGWRERPSSRPCGGDGADSVNGAESGVDPGAEPGYPQGADTGVGGCGHRDLRSTHSR